MKKKAVVIGMAVLLLFILFFPIKARLDDGGSVIYQSIARIYEIRKIKQLGNVGMTSTMTEGLSIQLFGKEVYCRMNACYLTEQMDWNGANGTTYFDAEIVEISEERILAEAVREGVGPIRPGTPVAFDPIVVDEQILQGLWVGDEVRIMYNDRQVTVEEPLWLRIVFSVRPLDENGEVITEDGATLHQGFAPSESPGSVEVCDGVEEWIMYTATPYSSLLLVDGERTACFALEKTEQEYPADTPAEEILAAVKEGQYVVLENSHLTSGGELWQEFYRKVQKEQNAQIRVVNYHTSDISNVSEDYSTLYFTSLVYVAGEGFYVVRRSNKETAENQMAVYYPYLMHYEGETSANTSDSRYDRYVLVKDNTVTWEEIMERMAISYSKLWIEHWEVYCNMIERTE